MVEWRDRNSSCIADLLHHVVTVSFPRLLPIVASLPCLCDVCSASESFMYAYVNARTSCSQRLGLPVVICDAAIRFRSISMHADPTTGSTAGCHRGQDQRDD